MSTRVYTETVCDRCQAVTVRPGAKDGCPPVAWGEVRIIRRLEGSGWTNSERLEVTVCPSCLAEVIDVARNNATAQYRSFQEPRP